jgi:hypothetical protein
MNEIFCQNCNKSFDGRYPSPGDYVICPHCGAEGYGTYDSTEDMNYTIEWYYDN